MQKALKGTRTKRKLASALEAALERKPLDRVRVHDLTDPCDIHRQTFYYHFEDVYALFAWCAAEDGTALAAEMAAAPGWREALEALLGFLAERRGYALALLDRPAERQVFFAQVLPPAARWDPRFAMILEPLVEKWVREDGAAEDLIGVLEALTV